MKTTDTTLDDLADSITALGNMIGEQFIGWETRFEKLEISQNRLVAGQISIKSELAELRREQRQTNERLTSLEDEMGALHSDIKELYDRIVKLEKRLDLAEVGESVPIRRELEDIKAWAREVSAQNGLPTPKF